MEIEIDGRKVQTEQGSSVLQAALDAGVVVPHFCYHKKLSVAAGCRMCLVDVEKMTRPVPACAIPVTEGMVIHTDSDQVKAARRAVMEFLLINHPLDCPVCDQGGECRLQDYSVEYGADVSRYQGEKRVVFVKDIGPLVSMQDMSRCIQCTRCVRFGQEVAGLMELGMMNRGEKVEVAPFPENWVSSELSGNLIDVCPVGALTSRPFRFTARGWELVSHPSVSPHDSLGSNLNVQTQDGLVKRVLPIDNDAINECWLSDRDRFSYEALNGADRLTVPMVKQGGEWIETDWQTALSYVAHGLRHIAEDHGDGALAALASPQATLEELYLLQKLMRSLGSEKIEYRLRQQDVSLDGKVLPWLGMPVDAVEKLDRMLVVGACLREESPLLAVRFRKAVADGAEVSRIHAMDEDWLMPVKEQLIGAPVDWLKLLAEVVHAVARKKGVAVPVGIEAVEPSHEAEVIADSLLSGERKAVFLGALALQHQQSSQILSIAEWLADTVGAVLGCFPAGANGVGGLVAKAYPAPSSGISLKSIASETSKAFLLLHTEPELESCNQPAMSAVLKQAEMVVVMSPFQHGMDYADVMLPVAPFTETAGTYINMAGAVQSFSAAALPLKATRPAWKVLRVLGNFLDQAGFDFNTPDEVRDACLSGIDLTQVLNNRSGQPVMYQPAVEDGYTRLGDMPALFGDVIVRRASSLQKTRQAMAPVAHLPVSLFESLGLADGDRIRVIQDSGEQVLPVCLDKTLPDTVVRVVSGHLDTAMLGPVDGWIRVERL